MSNAAQTVTTIVSLAVLIGAMLGAQAFWIGRALDRLDARIDRVEARLDRIDGRMDALIGTIVREHAERISRLEGGRA